MLETRVAGGDGIVVRELIGGESDDSLPYRYFVSFFCVGEDGSGGFGWSAIRTSGPICGPEEIGEVQSRLRVEGGYEDLKVVGWQPFDRAADEAGPPT